MRDAQTEARVALALSAAVRSVVDHADFVDSATVVCTECMTLLRADGACLELFGDHGMKSDAMLISVGEGWGTTARTLHECGLRDRARDTCAPACENHFEHSEWAAGVAENDSVPESALFVPIVLNDKAQGVLGLANKTGGFSQDDIETASLFGNIAAAALSNAMTRRLLDEGELQLEGLLAGMQVTAELERARARSYLDASAALMVGLTSSGKVMFANRALCEKLGREERDVLGKDWRSLAVPETAHQLVDECFSNLQCGKVSGDHWERRETPLVDGDGETRLIAWHNSVLRDADGEIVAAISSGEDITDKRRAMAALRESQTSLAEADQVKSAILQHTDVLTALLDTHFDFVWVNDAYASNGLRAPSYFPGRNHFDLYPDEANRAVFQRVLDTGEPYVVTERPFRYPSQPERGVTYWDWSLFPILDGTSRVTGLVLTASDATERVLSRADSSRNLERLRAAEQIAHVGHYEIDLTTGTAVWSDEVFRIFGLPTDAAAPDTKTYASLVHPDDLSAVYEMFESAREQTPFDLVYRILRSDAQERIVRSIGSVRDEAGCPTMFGTIQDVTEQTLAARALERSEEQFRLSLELSPDAVILHREGLIIWANTTATSILGVSGPDDLIGRQLLEFVHPEHRDAARDRFDLLADALSTPLAESKWVRMDGWPVHVDVMSAKIVTADGPVIETVARDISERKLAQEALAQSEERYRTLVQNSPLAIFVNRNDHVSYVNDECVRLMGAECRSQLVGKPVYELIAPQYHEHVAQQVALLKAGGSEHRGERTMVRVDGTLVDVEVSAAPFPDGDSTSIHVVLTDITERKRSEEQRFKYEARLSELAADLQRTGERERRRVAVELHDGVGQTLAAAKMSAQILASDCEDEATPEPLVRLLDLLGRSIDGVRLLTAELSPGALYELGLGPALSWLADSYANRYELECAVDVSAALAPLKSDVAILLFRIARELLNNVQRHSRVSVAEMTVWEVARGITLQVADKGCGFDTTKAKEEQSPWEHFGLFSIQEEVTRCGGVVHITSEPGSGTCVLVWIPTEVNPHEAAE